MAFDLNFDLIKKHPYATGAVVIVGGIIVFYLLSSSQSGGSSSGGSDFDAELQASAQQQALQAQENVQSSQTAAQVAQSQIAAQVANNQTTASLQMNDETTAAQLAASLAGITGSVDENQTNEEYQTVQQANEELSQQNETAMQDQVLESQINSGVVENANNNETALAADENNNQTGLSLAGIQAGIDQTELSNQQETSNKILSLVGTNVGAGPTAIAFIDAAEGQTEGNASIANGITAGNTQVAVANSTPNVLNSITKGVSSIAGGLFG